MEAVTLRMPAACSALVLGVHHGGRVRPAGMMHSLRSTSDRRLRPQVATCSALPDRRQTHISRIVCQLRQAYARAAQALLWHLRNMVMEAKHWHQRILGNPARERGWVLCAAAAQVHKSQSSPFPRWVVLAAAAAACLAIAGFMTLSKPKDARAPQQQPSASERMKAAADPEASSSQQPFQTAALGQPTPPAQAPKVSAQQAGDRRDSTAHAGGEGQAPSTVMPDSGSQLGRAALGQPSTSEVASAAAPPRTQQRAAAATKAPPPQPGTQLKRDLTPRPLFATSAQPASQPAPAEAATPAAKPARDLTPRPFFATASPAAPPAPAQASNAAPSTEPQRDLTPRPFFDTVPPAASPAPAPAPEAAPSAQPQRDLTTRPFFDTVPPAAASAPAQAPEAAFPSKPQRDLTPRAFFGTVPSAAASAPAQAPDAASPTKPQRDLTPRPFFDTAPHAASPAPAQASDTASPTKPQRDLTPRPFFDSGPPAASQATSSAPAQQPQVRSFSPFFGSAPQAAQPEAPSKPSASAPAGRSGADEKLPPPPPLAGHAEQAAAAEAIQKHAGQESSAAQSLAGAQIHEEVQASEPQPQSQPSQQAAREDDDLSGSNGPQDADPSQPDTMGIGEMSFDESISPWESVDGLVDDASDVSVLPGTRQQEAVAAGASLAQAVGSEAAEQRVRMLAAGVSLAHPEKPDQQGEDAFFVSRSGLGAVAVADGVGGWAADGIDAGEFSRQLMQGAADHVEAAEEEALDPVKVLRAGHAQVQSLPGSCTACVAVMHPEGELQVANLGDSGFRVFRDCKCVFASEAQQHAFNTPLQLGAFMEDGNQFDQPEDADVYRLQLQAGDVVVLATDGILDNMWERQMEKLIATYMEATMGGSQAQFTLRRLAKQIARQAQKNARRPNFRSPWAVERAKAGYGGLMQRLRPVGGKMDDCTAIVALVHAIPPPWA